MIKVFELGIMQLAALKLLPIVVFGLVWRKPGTQVSCQGSQIFPAGHSFSSKESRKEPRLIIHSFLSGFQNELSGHSGSLGTRTFETKGKKKVLFYLVFCKTFPILIVLL